MTWPTWLAGCLKPPACFHELAVWGTFIFQQERASELWYCTSVLLQLWAGHYAAFCYSFILKLFSLLQPLVSFLCVLRLLWCNVYSLCTCKYCINTHTHTHTHMNVYCMWYNFHRVHQKGREGNNSGLSWVVAFAVNNASLSLTLSIYIACTCSVFEYCTAGLLMEIVHILHDLYC